MDHLPYDAMKPLAARVLLKLANVAAQDGTRAWRNVWEVADELGVDRRSVQRALRELQAVDLIRVGDQLAVAHIRSDRRPVVYNLNFAWHRMYSLPEIPLPEADEEPETDGATKLSTDSHGATNGATPTVPLGTNRTTYLTVNEEPLVPDRALAREKDALPRGSYQDAIEPEATRRQRLINQPCPFNKRGGGHSIPPGGTCLRCGIHEGQYWHGVDVLWLDPAPETTGDNA